MTLQRHLPERTTSMNVTLEYGRGLPTIFQPYGKGRVDKV